MESGSVKLSSKQKLFAMELVGPAFSGVELFFLRMHVPII
jgi:hypothetical protein